MPCSICQKTGHNRRTCPERFTAIKPQNASCIALQDISDDVSCNSQDKTNDSSSDFNEKEILECSICFDVIDDDKNKVVTPCGHHFCFTCITKTFEKQEKGNCPICRENLITLPKRKTCEKLPAIIVDSLVDMELRYYANFLLRHSDSTPTERLRSWTMYIAHQINNFHDD